MLIPSISSSFILGRLDGQLGPQVRHSDAPIAGHDGVDVAQIRGPVPPIEVLEHLVERPILRGEVRRRCGGQLELLLRLFYMAFYTVFTLSDSFLVAFSSFSYRFLCFLATSRPVRGRWEAPRRCLSRRCPCGRPPCQPQTRSSQAPGPPIATS